jgi:hypothetical protein
VFLQAVPGFGQYRFVTALCGGERQSNRRSSAKPALLIAANLWTAEVLIIAPEPNLQARLDLTGLRALDSLIGGIIHCADAEPCLYIISR